MSLLQSHPMDFKEYCAYIQPHNESQGFLAWPRGVDTPYTHHGPEFLNLKYSKISVYIAIAP